ncbi:MAG: DUF4339 domain-containing protein [Thermoguttaceae bacterium]|nr:DUF4339 domain-containing protein [Thermoguttaceae bacterium]
MQLYYYEGSERKGPVTSVRLREMAQNGEIRPDTILETPSGIKAQASKIGSLAAGLSLEKEFASSAPADSDPLNLNADSIDLTSSPELNLDADSETLDLSLSPESAIETAFDAKPFEYVPYQVETMQASGLQRSASTSAPTLEDSPRSPKGELLQETLETEAKTETKTETKTENPVSTSAEPPVDASCPGSKPIDRSASGFQPSKKERHETAKLQPLEPQPAPPREPLKNAQSFRPLDASGESQQETHEKKDKDSYSTAFLVTEAIIALLIISFLSEEQSCYAIISIGAIIFISIFYLSLKNKAPSIKKTPASAEQQSALTLSPDVREKARATGANSQRSEDDDAFFGCFVAVLLIGLGFVPLIAGNLAAFGWFAAITIIVFCFYKAITNS